MRVLSAATLGATLYVPAIRDDLTDVLLRRPVAGLRSAVLCLEDAIRPADTDQALANVGAFLRVSMAEAPPAAALFVRARTADMLRRILDMPGVDRLDGVVAPKATPSNLEAWLAACAGGPRWVMPTLETAEVFDPGAVRALRDTLVAHRDRVLAIRIGGNDLLQLLNARRGRGRTAYDGPLGAVIAQLVCVFAPSGFDLSAPVMDDYSQPRTLRAEVARDLQHGLLTKTAIHPAQVAVIHNAYAVDAADLATATAILKADAPAVFARQGVLCEPATHSRWAVQMQARAAAFGVRRSPGRSSTDGARRPRLNGTARQIVSVSPP